MIETVDDDVFNFSSQYWKVLCIYMETVKLLCCRSIVLWNLCLLPFCCRTTSMLKNIFRNRRRSKNEPSADENEIGTQSGFQSNAIFPDNAVGSHCGNYDFDQGIDWQRNVEEFKLNNVSSAADVRSLQFDKDYANRVAVGSSVKNSGGHLDKRNKLSSVVNKILTRSQSKPAPRIRRIAASDLFTPPHKTTHNNGIRSSVTRLEEDAGNCGSFAVPYSCQSCISGAGRGAAGKSRFSSENSWMCSQCRMQNAKARERHQSTMSSPPALAVPSADSLDSEPTTAKLSSADSEICVSEESSCGKCSRDFNSRSSHHPESIDIAVFDGNKAFSAERVSDFNGTPYHRDLSSLPSPLHVCDLECHQSVLSDDDVIPELVDISSPSCGIGDNSTTGTVNCKQHSSPAVQPTVENEARNVNESDMYILTDSFLDVSSASFRYSVAASDFSPSTVAPEVMVADDYELMCSARSYYGDSRNTDLLTEQVSQPIVSPKFTSNAAKYFPCLPSLYPPEEQSWLKKPLSDWSTDDVLSWVLSVGLYQFYDTFHSKLC